MEETSNYFFKKKDRDTLVIATKKGTDVVFQLQSTVLKCTLSIIGVKLQNIKI